MGDILSSTLKPEVRDMYEECVVDKLHVHGNRNVYFLHMEVGHASILWHLSRLLKC